MKSAFLFLAMFALGAVAALAYRTARHDPSPASGLPTPVSQPPSPVSGLPTSVSNPPVNTVCAICGMDVDPKLPTAEYQGKTIGFGCRMCPPKFKAEPDKFGPLYLRNEVVKR
jgi:hypothetical protein